jgi:hypothetical protein
MMKIRRKTVFSPALRCLASGVCLLGNLALGETDFVRDIKPILERTCVQCHGPEKQKGGLRLDTRPALLKGGEIGPGMAPGNPGESELYRRVILEPSHEDVMPPKGKTPHLTAMETDLLKRWIAEGAPWPEGIVAIAKAADAGDVGPAPGAAELRARAELAKIGVRVRPLAHGSNWTRISFRVAPKEIPPEALGELRHLATLVELDLGTVNLKDEDLAHVAGLSNLAVLNLSETGLTDAGLDHLGRLAKLQILNLYGTKATDAGLAKLANLKQLRQLHVAATGVTDGGVAKLKSALPMLKLESGSDFSELAKMDFIGPVQPAKWTPQTSSASATAPVKTE